MLDLDAVVRSLTRDIGTVLRPMGFRGSGGVWRLVTGEGVVVVQKQGSRGSAWDDRLFFLDTSVVPKIWWEWKRGAAGSIDKAKAADGIRALEGRIRRVDGTDLWRVTDGADVNRLRADLLAAVAKGAGRAVELLKPGRYAAELSALPDKEVGHWDALVVLLAGHGQTPELRTACAGLRRAYADRSHAGAYVDRLIEWALNRPSPGDG